MRTLKSSPPRVPKNGFTLVEMAICILIVGLMIAAGSQAYSLYLKRQAIETTKTNVQIIASAIGNYRVLKGRYPCPASLTAARGSAAYGHESSVTCNIDTPLPAGVFLQHSGRSFPFVPTGSPPPASIPGAQIPVIRAGAVPFRELNLEEDQVIDGYGNRIFYIVTEILATDNWFQPDAGGIDVLNAQGVSALDVPYSAHFFIFSAGPDKAGAFSRNGAQTLPCPATGNESINCALTGAAKYIDTEIYTNKASPAYFDDVVSYFTQADLPLWQYSPNQLDIHEKPNGKVGIVTIDATNAYKLQIPGTVHISNDLMANQICDNPTPPTPAHCFPSSLIAGTYDGVTPNSGLGCPAGQFMTAIDSANPHCTAVVWAACPAGQAVTGLDNAGGLICSTPPLNCAATTVTVCGGTPGVATENLPTTVAGSPGIVFNVGDSDVTTYTCDNGTWKSSSTGVCQCTPQPATTQTVSCGDGFTGTMTQTNTYTCPASAWTGYVTTANNCTCQATTETQTLSCQTGFTGSIVQQRTHSCDTPAGTWTDWATIAGGNTCTCAPGQTNTSSTNCTGGLTGTITTTQTFDCHTATWGSPVVVNNCTCVPQTQTAVQSCPTGYIPNPVGIMVQNTFSCPAATWTTTQLSNDCIPAPPQICKWTLQSTGASGQPAPIGPAIGSTCDCAGAAIGGCSSQQGPSSYSNGTCSCQ